MWTPLIGLRPFANDYDYICFAHDKKTTQLKPLMVGKSFSYQCFENVLANRIFVENVITTFQENPRLGLLVPPPPLHSYLSQVTGNEWQSNFENTKKLAEKYHINVDINKDKPPIAPLGGIFWFSLKRLISYLKRICGMKIFRKNPLGKLMGISCMRSNVCIPLQPSKRDIIRAGS